MKKNVSSQTIGAQLINASDGSAVVSGTTNVFITGDGGAQSAGAGTLVHEGNGFWSYSPTQAETNFDHIAFTFTNSLAINATIQTYTTFPQSADINSDPRIANLDATISSRASTFELSTVNDNIINEGNSNWLTATGFSTFDPSSDTVANVTNVANNADMRGTDNALLSSSYTAPDNAGISSNGSAISLIPTNPLLTNDSRLDNLDATISSRSTFDSSTDQVVSSNMRGTDGANTVTPPTVTEIDTELTSSHGSGSWVTGGGSSNVNVISIGGNSVSSPDDLKADVSNLDVAVSSRSTFDSSVDQVVASNMRGTDGANTVEPPSASDIYTEFTSSGNEDAFKADVSTIESQVEDIIKYHNNDVAFLESDNSTETIQSLAFYMVVFDNDGVTRLKTISFRDSSNSPIDLPNATNYTLL